VKIPGTATDIVQRPTKKCQIVGGTNKKTDAKRGPLGGVIPQQTPNRTDRKRRGKKRNC